MMAAPEPQPVPGILSEKADSSQLENSHKGADSEEYQEYLRLENTVFVGQRKAKLLRKMDWRVTLPMATAYLIGYVDRGNIANAKLFGLLPDLSMTNGMYNVALMVFFFTYAANEIPSQILNKRIGPRKYISLVMVGFGIVTMCTAFCFNYAGLIVCRLMLGIFEAGLFPGVIYVLSYFYSRWELQTRISIFYAGASASGAFAGLLGYAIAELDNVLGYRAWRWIFGIEGLATILFGFTAWFIISESPAKATWLTEQEKRYITLRQIYAQGPIANKTHFEWRYVHQALRDWKSYIGCILFFGTSVPVYGLSYTLPTIVNNLGYSAARASALSAPPYIFAAIMCVLVAMFADRIRQRGYILAGSFFVAAIGYAIIMATVGKSNLTGVTLFGIFVTAAGLYSATPPMMAWVAIVFEGEVKRGIAISIVPTIGQMGGVIGSNIYLAAEAPKYNTGFGVSLGFVLVAGLITSLGMRVTLKRINHNRDHVSEADVRAKYTQEELSEMGDQSPLFRYPL